MNNVSTFTPTNARKTVEQAIIDAQNCNLTDILILGWDDSGSLVTRSSHLTRAEALFMIEYSKLDILNLRGTDDE